MKFDLYKMRDKYKLSDTEQKLLAFILEHHEEALSMGVRQIAARNFVSPALVIKLSKKMGFTGFTDMVYRLNFLIQNRARNDVILITSTGFCSPVAEFIARKLLVRGYRCIQSNAYGVYDKNPLGAGLMIAISKSGETDTITRVVDYGKENGVDIISFTGEQSNHIARCSTVNIPILDDQALDDRNMEANYFYARVMIVFEYLMDQLLCEW